MLATQLLAPLYAAIQGGEQHQRPPLLLAPDAPFLAYIETGYALRACLEDRLQHDYLLQRLRPHASVIVGTLPAGLQPHSMLPRSPALPHFRPLQQISDTEIHDWLVQDAGLIYGELQQDELERYFAAIAPFVAPGGLMVDLGSGLGKVVMTAALSLPFRRCVGVELMAYRHQLALQRCQHMLALNGQQLAQLPPPLQHEQTLLLPSGASMTLAHLRDLPQRLAFIEADMFKVDVSAATLVFLYSTCFGPLMPALAQKLASELQPGALVSTTTYPLQHPAFRILQHFPAGTLAWTSVNLYQRYGDWDGSAAAPLSYGADPAEWEARARAELAAR
ncbi:histone methylation protein DOT1-like protein [Duganella qianjiadongensis]|uniref:Histone methylation protein DOT1-like protein n=1 Tax=Duganella qianjiadongensis TaxID=2692176 RepID=A0ABW9VJ89_9BURK|nr:histone methylation protein DOT1-like protein [Duganella qianjiadongensis]MYM38725.1 histone methylation protein DOT1-like protein [Duganella qianjiadongensis]